MLFRKKFLILALIFITGSAGFIALRNTGTTEHPVQMMSSGLGEPDNTLLTHRIIMTDQHYGLTSGEEVQAALSNTQFVLSKITKQCSSSRNTGQFLQCANNILGEHFSYQETALATEGYSRGISDCDLNVYLLLDAARLLNQKINIVYAPGHAFIAYTDENGQPQFWETIEPDNHGQPAELWTSGYAKTLHPFFYTPQPENKIEKIYQLYISDKLPENERIHLLSALHETLQDNPLYLSAYYGNKKDITPKDIRHLLYLLQSDTYSFDKKIIAARYFNVNKDYQRAEDLLSAIPARQCVTECLKEKAKHSVKYKIIYAIASNSSYKSEYIINEAIKSIKDGLIYLSLFFLVLIILICRKEIAEKYNHNRRRSRQHVKRK
ncbi:hypothetical protein ABQ37_004421 [Salmonella enterica subsp. enterica serovar Sandiego]|nr:hypothetical protein [Salmonella enterica]EBV9368679.1 hypothetical protein [Salmonella enterica subsp. enterica serovar Sandiego]ECT6635828.1 hypothetical protein [Salmonella enterica subsp. enterica serovar Rissen]EDV1763289.1 hypothetical protein [Salmonella enterica subsp. enterica serovar Hvittingfoss]EEJ7304477.1 hypothetical protein [Salmonella enterica subsp. enterica]